MLKVGLYKRAVVLCIVSLFLFSSISAANAELKIDLREDLVNNSSEQKHYDTILLPDQENKYEREEKVNPTSYDQSVHFQAINNKNENDYSNDFLENYWNIIVPDDYPSIREAINHADSGYRIYVREGEYEENLMIKKSIILQGENKDSTIISGDNLEDVITVDCGYTLISGFTINNGINGINLNASSGNNIKNNRIESNTGNGIIMFRSYGNTIEENIIEQNDKNGIQVRSCFGNIIAKNEISINEDNGILIEGASRNNVISSNDIQSCSYGLKTIDESENNQIKFNSFFDNEMNAYDSSVNIWDDTFGYGNYWDDYSGHDSNGDGIGDTPYSIPGGDNVDHYPLVNPSFKDSSLTKKYKINMETKELNDDQKTLSGSFSTIVVPDDYSSIQEAIDHAKDGDTVEVKNGAYYENILVDKTISILGESKDNAIIDGDDEGNVLFISADNVQISGFTIRNTELDSAGIKTISDGNIITDNIITECGVGIHLSDSDNCDISNNRFYGNNWGIFSEYSNNNKISDNNIVGNIDGMIIFQSYNNEIKNNRVNNNNFEGILTFYCDNNIFDGNTIEENNEYGIQIFSSKNNNLKNNIFDDNIKDAITLFKSDDNVFSLNTIEDGPNGISLWVNSENNTIIDNEFLTNVENGIILSKSSKNVIENNLIEDCNNAVYMCAMSENNSIDSNVFRDCNNFGFVIDYANNADIVSNNFFNCSLYISYTCGNIIESNYVGDKPLVYLEEESHQTIQDAGQVILVNCNNITLKNLIISSIPIGVEIISSSECHIDNCEISDISRYGLFLHENSRDITLSNNLVTNNQFGIYVQEASQNISIHHNSISENNCGIYFKKAENNKIFENSISNNFETGLLLSSQSKLNKIYDNSIIKQTNYGIEITAQSSYNNISGNIISDNTYGLKIIDSSSNTISNNEISNNKEDGIYILGDSYHKIRKNTIKYNKNGINLFNSDSNSIESNNVTYHSNDGIYSKNSENNFIRSNVLSLNNGNGIHLYNCEETIIEYNTISYNKEAGMKEFFSGGYPKIFENQISKNNFIKNKDHGYFRSSQGGIIRGYLWYRDIGNWNKNYWDDWNGNGYKRIIGDMWVYGDIFSVPFWINDHYPSSTPFYFTPPSTSPEITKSLLTTSVEKSDEYDTPTNKFEFGTEIISYSEMENAKVGDIVKWEWYHNGEIQHINVYTLTLDGSMAFWSGWTPDETGWWQIQIYHNEKHQGASPEFIVYEKHQQIIHTLLTDWVKDVDPEPKIYIPSTKFEQGNTIYTYSEMKNAQEGDSIKWEWYHEGEIKHSKTEEIPFNGVVAFWDGWIPDDLGVWHVKIYCNGNLLGISPEFFVLNSLDNNRIGLGEAMTCKWINGSKCGPMELVSGVNETMHCYTTFTAQLLYDWNGDTFGWKWYHNGKIIAEDEETLNQKYKGIVSMYFSVDHISEGTGFVELYVNGEYLGKTNTYEVIDGYHDITSIAGIGEALTCKWAHGTNNHGSFHFNFNSDETIHFYASFTTKSYNWYGDTFGWKWYHNGKIIAEDEETLNQNYTGTVALYDSQDQLTNGTGYIELYWNGEYFGKTNVYMVS